jgi:hypothetical protein
MAESTTAQLGVAAQSVARTDRSEGCAGVQPIGEAKYISLVALGSFRT